MTGLIRQLTSFVGVGVVSTLLHYAVLVGLVQILRAPPVPATLCGFVCGGTMSYVLNRKHTFGSERAHEEAAWRFAFVAGVAFVFTFLLMRQLYGAWHVPYLAAQVMTTGVVMIWNFVANRFWTFRGET